MMTMAEDESAKPADAVPPSSGLHASEPSVARVYDAIMGGKDNFAVDRAVAEQWRQVIPQAPHLIMEARRFLHRVVRFMVNEAGIRQFIDIGSGLPTAENTHQVAQREAAETRVVYVDNDPVVLTHGQALLAENSSTRVLAGDLRDPEAILRAAASTGLVDLDRPVGVLMMAVVHHLLDEEDPEGIVGRLRDGIAAGSYLGITHFYDAGPDSEAAELQNILQQSLGRGRFRTRPEIERLFTGLEVVPPGLVHLPNWRPERPEDATMLPGSASVLGFGGVGRKP
jgi:S-adenosyl methyltransferase